MLLLWCNLFIRWQQPCTGGGGGALCIIIIPRDSTNMKLQVTNFSSPAETEMAQLAA